MWCGDEDGRLAAHQLPTQGLVAGDSVADILTPLKEAATRVSLSVDDVEQPKRDVHTARSLVVSARHLAGGHAVDARDSP
jgi:hypothetical protein